jgi:hypothetical protein
MRNEDTHSDNGQGDSGLEHDLALSRLQRVILLVLAVSAAAEGAWAQFAPASFYVGFPGARRFWVSLDGPYNEHLIRDVGGLNLALAVLTAAAAIHGRARLARLAAACWLIYSVPHVVYHAAHLGPFGAVDATSQIVALALQVAAPVWTLLATTPRHSRNRPDANDVSST